MRKILYVTTIATTVNAFLVPHIQMFIEQGNIVDCACCIDIEINESLINNGVRIFDIPFTRNPLDLRNIKAFRELIKIQKKYKYDIVHVHTPIASIYGRLLKIKFPNLKTIYTAHGFHFYKGAPKFKWITFYNIEKFMSKFTDTIITINKEDYNIASNKFYTNNILNINGVGVNLDDYIYDDLNNDIRSELGISQDDIVLTVVAELCKRKNQIQIIRAFEILIKKYDNLKLLLVGNGDLYKEISAYIINKKLNNHIKLLGYRNDVAKILNATDIVGLFSYHEGLPRNLMEAMVAKKPIICTNIRGNNDLVKHNINGILVNVNDIESTVEAIEQLYENVDLRISMGERGFEIIKKHYSLENVLNQIKNIYI